MLDLDDEDCSVAEGDCISIGGFTSKVQKVSVISPKAVMIDVTKAPRVSSSRRGNICFAESTVCLHGKVFSVPENSYASYQSILIKFDKKRKTVDINAHTLNVNASGFLTTDGIV